MRQLLILLLLAACPAFCPAQDPVLRTALSLNVLRAQATDGFNRSNGYELNPALALALGNSSVYLGPSVSIDNMIKYRKAGINGVSLVYFLRFNAREKQFGYGIIYHLLYERYLNATNEKFNQGNYSICSNYGLQFSLAASPRISCTLRAAIGSGYGESTQPEHMPANYRSTAYTLSVGMNYNLGKNEVYLF